MSEEIIETEIKLDPSFIVNAVAMTYSPKDNNKINYTLTFDADRILTPTELVDVLNAVSSMLNIAGI